MIKITTKLLEDLGACSKAIEWHKKQKTTSFNKLFKLCQKENHLDWARWLIVKLLNPDQAVRYFGYAEKKALSLCRKYKGDLLMPRQVFFDYLRGTATLGTVEFVLSYSGIWANEAKEIIKYGIELLKETKR